MKIDFDTTKLEQFDTLIFDYDGTLINSEPYNKLAHSMVLSHILDKEFNLTDEEYARYTGKKDTDIYEMYKQDFCVDFDTEEMITKKAETVKDLICNDDIKIYDFFYEIVKNKGNKHLYIVSNNHEKALFPVLEQKGIINHFDKVFCLPKMKVQKSYFYENLNEFIPNANKVVVFEDNAMVLKYLENLGYTVVAVQNEMNFDDIEGKFENVIKV